MTPYPPWVLVFSDEVADVWMLMVIHQLRFPSTQVSAKPWQSPWFKSEQRHQRHSGQYSAFLVPSLNDRQCPLLTQKPIPGKRPNVKPGELHRGSSNTSVTQPFHHGQVLAHPDRGTLPWVRSTCEKSVNFTNWRNSFQPRLCHSRPEKKAE